VYGDGHSEELVGRVAKGRRDQLFIATKFAPENNSYQGIIKSAERSLKNLDTDYIDLYQIHWPNPSIPIYETMEAMEKLVRDGKVRHIGLSNFSAKEMIDAQYVLHTELIVSNQVEYNLFDRFIEKSILPHCEKVKSTVIAYSPLDKGRAVEGEERIQLLKKIAMAHDRTPAQVAINWLIRNPSVVVIPKAIKDQHIYQNATASDFELTDKEAYEIDAICTAEPEYIQVDQIQISLEGEGNRKVYQTLEQAYDNPLKFSPSPEELAEFIREGEPTKPVRLLYSRSRDDKYKYELIEGRIRYWAWVIAYGKEKPVPAYIRQS
jgi:diketogulonate reductase-like aldo/keto reductase